MIPIDFSGLTANLKGVSSVTPIGRVVGTGRGTLRVSGLSKHVSLGDRVVISPASASEIEAEVLLLGPNEITVLVAGVVNGVGLGDAVRMRRKTGFCPHSSWIGRILDANGQPLDGQFLERGKQDYPLLSPPPDAAKRRALGARIETGQKLFNTILPVAQGQRIGLFAGSGVGKSTLLGQLARDIDTDVTVIALVGERGREVREFVDETLGPQGLSRSVVIAATSDKSPLEKRQAAWAAMSVAEFFRDQGKQVFLFVDSITRFAEAHREIALAAGESPSMRGFPPSTSQTIMSLCERSGPGWGTAGDITAVFSVLVAGSDMEEPVADIIRGVLDGHIVLDRKIAERGRFPAVDILRSVSRSLPGVANDDENRLIARARRVMGAYDSAELMIQAGLYSSGSDPLVDAAIEIWPRIDSFVSQVEPNRAENSFHDLSEVLGQEIP